MWMAGVRVASDLSLTILWTLPRADWCGIGGYLGDELLPVFYVWVLGFLCGAIVAGYWRRAAGQIGGAQQA